MRKTLTSDKGVKRVQRAGLADTAAVRSVPFVVETRPLGLRAGIDAAGFNKLADEFEADAFVNIVRRMSSKPANRR
jgi:hypothetical protein